MPTDPPYGITCVVTNPDGTPVIGSNGTDCSANLDYSSTSAMLQIQQYWGRQGDTANIPLTFSHNGNVGMPSPVVEPMATVNLTNAITGQDIFSGTINNPAFIFESSNLCTFYLQCVDLSLGASTSYVNTAFSGLDAGQIVVDLVANANKNTGSGITAAMTQNGGFVQNAGITVPFQSFQFMTLQQALQQVTQTASQSSQFGWSVDQNGALHWYDQFHAPAPIVKLTDNISEGFATSSHPGGGSSPGPPYLGHIEVNPQFRYEWDGTQYYDQIVVVGATADVPLNITSGIPTDSWVVQYSGQSSFPLSQPILQQDTAATFVGIEAFMTITNQSGAVLTPQVGLQQAEIGGPTAGGIRAWEIVQSGTGQWLLTYLPHYDTPQRTYFPHVKSIISLYYSYQIPLVGINTPRAPQYGRHFAEVVTDNSLVTQAAVNARAQREYTEYGRIEERLTAYATQDMVGHFNAGDVITCELTQIPDSQNSYQLGLTDNFIVTSNTITLLPEGFKQYNFQAMRISTS